MNLTPHQKRLLWHMVLHPKPLSADEVKGLGVKTDDRTDLVKAGLLSESKKGTSKSFAIQDRAWRVLSEQLDRIQFPASTKSSRLLETIASHLGRYVMAKGGQLADLFAPEPDFSGKVEAAYLKVTGGKWDQRVRFKELAAELPGVEISQIHQVANQWMTEGRLRWSPIDNPRERTREDNLMALMLGRERIDMIFLQPA